MRCPKCGANRVDGKRFCTSCGEDFFKEDSVVRIIDEEPIRYKSAEIQSAQNYAAVTRFDERKLSKKKLSKKKLIVFSSLLAASIINFAVFILYNSFDKKEYNYDGNFVLMSKDDKGKRSLHLGIPGKKEVKLAADVAYVDSYYYINTGNNSRKILYLTKDSRLFEVDKNGDKELVAKMVLKDYLSTSPDLTKYLFITGDKFELYLKEIGRDKVKIYDGVARAYFLADNKTVIFETSKGEIFIRRERGEVVELANSVYQVSLVDISVGILYTDYRLCNHYINTKTGENKKLTDYWEDRTFGIDNNNNIYYSKDGSLYVLKNGKRSTKIADDVAECRVLGEILVYRDLVGQWYAMDIGSEKSYPLPNLDKHNYMHYSNGYIVYTDKSNTLFRLKMGTDNNEEINKHVTTMYYVEDEIYFKVTDKSQALYKLEKDGSSSKLHENVNLIQTVDDSYLAYLTEDGDLYVDGKKYSDVRGFEVGGRNICYISSEDELYLIEGVGKPKKISEDVSGYSAIYFGGNYLLQIKRIILN